MKQLDPKAVWLFFLSYVVQFLFTILFVGAWALLFMVDTPEEEAAFAFPDSFGYMIGLAALAIVLAFIWAKLSYHFYRYELTDAGFKKESGVIWKKYVTIPYARIQNVDIYRGILARILGLSDLNIQTAGASATVTRYGALGIGAEGRLPGLSKDEAEKVRDELVNRAQKTGGGV